jgi:hypothetical protein
VFEHPGFACFIKGPGTPCILLLEPNVANVDATAREGNRFIVQKSRSVQVVVNPSHRRIQEVPWCMKFTDNFACRGPGIVQRF